MSSGASETDALIIGAGLSGSAIAHVLTEAGVRVTLLEQGPEVRATDHPTFTNEWEFAHLRDWATNTNVRQLPQDYPVTGGGFQPLMFNAVGGSTNHFAAFWHRLKPVDFRKGTEHGLEETIDWPITYEDLEPFYDLHDRYVGVSGLAGNPAYPPTSSPRLPPLRHGNYANVTANALDKLGWHWWPSDNGIISTPYDGRLPCNLCGFCAEGCPRGSLGTVTEIYVNRARRNGLDLRPNARVSRILFDSAGAANGAEYIDLESGEMQKVTANLVIVACNGIGTPRLLLNSACEVHADGVANQHDQVGRNLILHGYSLNELWMEEQTDQYKGPFGAALYCQEFYDTDLSRESVNGMTITIFASGGPAISALGGFTGLNPAPWGHNHHEEFERRFNHNLIAAVQTEDLPVATNRVTLDQAVVDSSGLPAAQASYELHENDRRLLLYGIDRVREIGEAAGAYRIDAQDVTDNYNPPGWHLMGTCRMGDDPRNSVVDKWNRAWGVPGLVVCDSSSIVTGGAGNPAATIGALALRCAQKLVKDMNGGKIEAEPHSSSRA